MVKGESHHSSLGRDDILRYLRQVGQHLHQQGLTGEILLLGGAYMTVVLQEREATKDVDAYFAANAAAIREAAVRVANENNLNPNWLNDAAKGFLYRQPETTVWLDCPGLRVFAPLEDYIFAMKALAGRAEDIRDLKALRDRLGLTTVENALDVVQRYIPKRLLTPRVRLLIEVLFEEGA